MIAEYIQAITYECRIIPETKNTMIIAETDFIECEPYEVAFIEDCIKHHSNVDTVFSRARNMTVNDEIISGIVRWNKNDDYGDSIVVRYKNKYYTNLEPIWSDSIRDRDKFEEPDYSIGDLVKIRTGKTGIIQRYIGNGYYNVKFGNRIENVHVKGFL